jgi:hypothetical protein
VRAKVRAGPLLTVETMRYLTVAWVVLSGAAGTYAPLHVLARVGAGWWAFPVAAAFGVIPGAISGLVFAERERDVASRHL